MRMAFRLGSRQGDGMAGVVLEWLVEAQELDRLWILVGVRRAGRWIGVRMEGGGWEGFWMGKGLGLCLA